MEYYSQKETQQDKWLIEEVFADNGRGFFVDIGAADGIRLSNTYALEKRGWTGICVEPRIDDFKKLKANRPNSQCVCTCIGIECVCDAEFVVCNTDQLLSGLKNTLGDYMGRPVTGDIVLTEVITMAELLRLYDAPSIIEYLSVDTEGNEFDILRSIPFDIYKFKALTIEHNYVEPMRSQILALLYHYGYKRVREAKFDDFYLHKELC